MSKNWELVGHDVLLTERVSGYDNVTNVATAFRLSCVVRWEPIGYKSDQTRVWLNDCDQRPLDVPIHFNQFTKIIATPLACSIDDFDIV